MLIHPWDAATGPAEWQDWLATTGRFGVLAVNNLDPARGPLVLPLHVTVAGDELLMHLARPNPVWPHLEAAAEVRLAVTGDYAYIPTYWRAKAGGPDEDGVPTSYYAAVQFVCRPTWSMTPRARRRSSPPSSPISSPRAATPPWRRARRRTGGCCPASAASGWRCCGWTPSSNTTTPNPAEHRQRVTGHLEQRSRGLDAGAAAQQRRRLAAIGDCKTRQVGP